jgi:polyisoprenoid-binding protein YceI
MKFMKSRHTPSLFVLLGVLCSLAARPSLAAPEQYEFDTNHLVVAFMVSHIGYAKVLGMFRKAGGGFTFDEDTQQLSDVKLVIDTASVLTNQEKRDDHLRSTDFLNVVEFPEMTFTAAGAKSISDRQFQVDGTLTLLGVSKPVTLNMVWNKSDTYPFRQYGLSPHYAMGVSGRGSFKRSDFGMSYAVDNGWVGDEIELIIELEAIRQ